MPSTKEQVCDHLDFILSDDNNLDDPRFRNRPPSESEINDMYEAWMREKQSKKPTSPMIRLNKVT
jgi:hypothetical protein